jgi:hypothetical protein
MNSRVFPQHDIDPSLKNKEWHLQFCEAAWYNNDSLPGRMFYRNTDRYDLIRQYALADQPTYKYKRTMGVDEQTDTSYLNIDFNILPVIKKHRAIALGLLKKREYNIVATPVDALARDQIDRQVAEIKVKLMMREEAAKINPQLLNSPVMGMETGEPGDMDEFTMMEKHGWKHAMALEAELGIRMVFEENDIAQIRDKVWDDNFDYGVAVVRDYIDNNKRIRLRHCDLRNIISNACIYSDFRDALYFGELQYMTLNELKMEAGDQFSKRDYEEVINASQGKYGNPRYGSERDADRYKVKVLDMQWLSIDEYVYEERIDKRGNLQVGKAKYEAKGEKFKRKKFQMVYRAKYIIDTDKIYNWGLEEYQLRDYKSISKAKLNFHVLTTYFENMVTKGIMEDIIPIGDQTQIAWLKLQNIRNQLLPFLIEMDLTALEGVAYGKGGKVMTPKELVEMMFQTGILITRRAELAGTNVNYKSIEYIQTNYGQAIAEAWNDLTNNINMIREATGFNELTDGSTPNPKTLTTPAKMAYEATNNSLYQLVFAEKQLLLSLAKTVVCRLQRAVKEGDVSGYVHSLGTNTIRFFQMSPEFALHHYGIILEDKPTDEQKIMLQQHIQESIAQGLLDVTDAIMIENVPNLKQQQQILNLKIEKNKKRKQEEAMQMQQQNAQVQMQSAQAAEQSKQQTMQMEWQLKTQYMIQEKQMEMEIKKLELQVKYGMSQEALASQEKMKAAETLGQPPVSQAQAQPMQPTEGESPEHQAIGMDEEQIASADQAMQEGVPEEQMA